MTTSSLQIREATEADIPAIQHLLQISELYCAADDTEANFRRKLAMDKDLMLIAVDNHKPIGFVMASYDGWAALIWHLCIVPEFRGQGTAKMLLSEISRRLVNRGANIGYGLVMPDNTRMISCLPSLKFRKENEVVVVSRPLI